MIEFLSRLIENYEQKIFLILDNLKVHHGKIVAEWVEEHKERIELLFFPAYSPQINPDEYLNHMLKRMFIQEIYLILKSNLKKDSNFYESHFWTTC